MGAPFTFGTALIGTNVRIAGPNTAISVNDIVLWIGQENFIYMMVVYKQSHVQSEVCF